MNDSAKILSLESRIKELEQELDTTKQHLKKYTAPASSKVYYEKHKEEQKQRVREYKKRIKYKPTPEQSKRYYETQKQKRKQAKEDALKLEETV